MLKFLNVVMVVIFMAPEAGSWTISLVGFNRHTIFLRGKLISERKDQHVRIIGDTDLVHVKGG